MQPSISVVVPLFNKGRFIEDALRSILSQTVPVHEIVVVDDGSTDSGAQQVEAVADPRISLIRQTNAGVSVARNTGIEAASGDLIAFLDADDRYRPGFFDSILSLVSEFPDAGLFGTGYRKFRSADGCADSFLPVPSGSPNRGLVHDFYSAWGRSSFISTISIAVKARTFRESGIRFPGGERLGEDQDVWFRLAERYPVAFDPCVQSEYRVGVVGSATYAGGGFDPLPCYGRLAERLSRREVPGHLVAGARRLLASHLLNVARTRLSSRDRRGAWRMLRNPMVWGNPGYLLRTAIALGAASFGRGLSR